MRYMIAATILLFALASSACGGAPPPEEAASAPEPAAAEPAAELPTDPAAAETPALAEPTDPPAPNSADQNIPALEQVGGGLEELDSYRLEFAFSFVGEAADGSAQSGEIELEQTYIAATGDQRMQFSTQGFLQPGEAAGLSGDSAVEFLRLDGVSYINVMDANSQTPQCVSFSDGDEAAMGLGTQFSPGDVIGGINDPQLVAEGETVNGIVTDQYTFREVRFGNFSDVAGAVWVAQEGGYIVRYQGEVTGQMDLEDGESVGDFTWTYNVQDVNAVETIELPAACAQETMMEDIPLPDDATNQARLGTIFTFESSQDAAALAEFYRSELTAQGWVEGEGSSINGLQILAFTSSDRQLSITITSQEGGSSVLMSEEPAEETPE